MNFKIWISTDESGTPRVGAHMMGPGTTDSEHIFPSQMGHRCTARDKTGKIRICTPTGARADGFDVIGYFPKADGSLGRGY